jgi:hypothetical protein
MPWKCPLCGTLIRPVLNEDPVLTRTVYRCNICRLELIVDRQADQLVLAGT